MILRNLSYFPNPGLEVTISIIHKEKEISSILTDEFKNSIYGSELNASKIAGRGNN